MAAADVAREHGVFRTAKVLRLDYSKLKQLTMRGGEHQRRKESATPGFVELIPAPPSSLPECLKARFDDVFGHQRKPKMFLAGLHARVSTNDQRILAMQSRVYRPARSRDPVSGGATNRRPLTVPSRDRCEL